MLRHASAPTLTCVGRHPVFHCAPRAGWAASRAEEEEPNILFPKAWGTGLQAHEPPSRQERTFVLRVATDQSTSNNLR